jgi:exodeoxyribonuclease VII small subunit
MAKKKSAKTDEPKFEESVVRLQQIVAELESGSLGLEESLAQFEQGTGLLRSCYQFLESAEQKIEILTRLSEDGTVSTEPFEAKASAEKTDARRRNHTRSAIDDEQSPPKETVTDDDDVPPDADVRSLFD